MSPTGFEPAIARLEVGYLIRFGHEPKERVGNNSFIAQQSFFPGVRVLN